MKSFFWSLLLVFCTWSLFFIGKGVDTIDIMGERYKRALDAGTYAAATYRAYDEAIYLQNQGTGFGIGTEDRSNVMVDRDAAVRWFYRLFFTNLAINDTDKQEQLKRYIPMKALILYDRLMIADLNDDWFSYYPSGEKEYIIRYNGKDYKFTLSDQIYDISRSVWIRDIDLGLREDERKAILTEYIAGEIEGFLRSRENKESCNDYRIVFSLDDTKDEKLSGINGVNFIVLCEGLPIPSLNPFRREKFYAYSVGGSEIVR